MSPPRGTPFQSLESHLATASLDELLQHPELDTETENMMAYPIANEADRLRVKFVAQASGSKGARINTISPGVISIPMGDSELAGEDENYIVAMVERSGARRKGTSEDIAEAAVFLVSPDSTLITGNDILVGGSVVPTRRWNAVSSQAAWKYVLAFQGQSILSLSLLR